MKLKLIQMIELHHHFLELEYQLNPDYNLYLRLSESKVNKFLTKNDSNFEPFNYITIKLLYTTKPPVKKPEPFW